ncbi:S-layer homology domain-containing protein, partial [Intestinibacillus massiliensis]|uniref:S-layer homology domain-containing protein n=1 Tax=Intestinibacillus massiliensis TaxID=1871029 RepID=UPI00117B58B8
MMKIFTKRLGAAVIAFALLCGIGTVPAGAEGLQASAEEGVTPPADSAGQETGTPPADGAGQGTETPPADSAGQETGTPPVDGAGQAGNGLAPEGQDGEGRSAAAPSPANFAEPAADGLPDDGARQVTLDNGTLYANGVPVVIKKDGDGQKAVYDADGAIKLMDAPNLTTVYGGGKNADVDGDTSVTVEDLSLTVYGGGYSDGTHSANVSGDAYICVTGTQVAHTYGGGYAIGQNGEAFANVAGTVRSDILAQVPRPEEGYTKNGHDIVGGGYASSQRYAAHATVGDAFTKSGEPIHVIRGGGYAVSAQRKTADASAGAVAMTLLNGDIREVYGAGYASGANAVADAESVYITGDQTEVSVTLRGGGTATGSGRASVRGLAKIELKNQSRILSYLYGGGNASSGGTADVGSAEISLTGCQMPIQMSSFGLSAGAIYMGGAASGENASAVTGDMKIGITDSVMAGRVYGAGEASQKGDAHGGACEMTLSNVRRDYFSDTQYAGLTLLADGDASGASQASPTGTVKFSLTGSAVDMVVGGTEGADELESCDVYLDWGKGNDPEVIIGCIDYWALAEPFQIGTFAPAAKGTKVKASAEDWPDGAVILSRPKTTVEHAETFGFTADGGTLTLEAANGDGTAVQWRYTKPAKEPEPAPDPEPDPEPGTPTPNPPSGGSTSSSSPSTPSKPSESTKVEDKGGATVETVTKTEVSGSTTTVTETQTATDRQTGEVTRTETVSMDDKQSGVSTKVTTQTGADGAVSAEAHTEVNTGTATVKDGVASAVLGGQAAQALIQQAEKAAQALGQADQAKADVVVQAGLPEGQAASVGTVQVQLPKKAAAALGAQAAADMTVKTPVADVTIPSKALADLAGRTGDTVTVSAARAADDTVRVAVSVGGREAGQVEGGLKAAVPSPSLTAGTVAVVVKADGTEELVPKSVVVGDGMVVPLEGSATIRLVDNSKPFADASQAPWAEPALSFVSARGLFTGVDDTHFDPGGAVSRGMLATVLSRLEDAPQAATAQRFDDVQPGQYYSSAVHWAAENGIVSGDGTGKFAPDRAISREELAVCLYRYSGMLGAPTGTRAALDGFADAHQVSGWAQDAMAYAVGAGLMD